MLLLSLYCKAKALVASRDRGATAIEYALLITLVAAALVATVIVFRTGLGNLMTNACNAITAGTC
jgi:Flp pilus assembly pilin Flp